MRAFPPLEECFLLRMLYDLGGKTEYVSKKNYDNVQHFSHWRFCGSPLRLRRQKKGTVAARRFAPLDKLGRAGQGQGILGNLIIREVRDIR